MDLSVVIPSYRAEPFIARAIESALAEGVLPQNIVVVEDGVFDRTAEIVRRFEGVRLITQERNMGAPRARNAGLAEVSTRYVMFLDADDYVKNGLLHGLVEVLEREAGEVGMGPWCYAGEGRSEGLVRVPPPMSHADWVFAWLRLKFFPPCCVVWNASSLRRIGAWDERLRKNQDGELMIRAFVRSLRVSVSDTGLGVYWQHASPHRVTSAKVDDLLHATEIVFAQLEAWSRASAEGGIPASHRSALGRYCCVTAWHAFAHDRKEQGMRWMARARAYGFQRKGYNHKTSLLAACFGVSLSSKLRVFIERSGVLYNIRYQR